MATLQYDFQVVGMNSVMAAFRSLEQRALQHNRVIARTFGGTGGGAGGAGGAARAGGARGGQADAHVRERQRVLRQQAADDRRSFQESARSHRQFLTFRDRMYREERQQQDRHAREQIRTARRMERERLAERKKAEQQAYRTAYRKASSRYDAGVGALTSLGSRAAGMLALGGGAAIAAGISSELKLGKESTLLAVMSKQAGEKGNIKDIQKGLTDRVREVGKESGLDRADLVAGMTKFFSKSGNVDIAKEMLPFFAEMSDITGSSLEDIGDTAGMAFMQALKKGLSPQEAKKVTEDILAAFAGQAAFGTIEMKDFAAYGPSLLSTAARFKGDYGQMAAVTAAMAQTGAYGGANKAAEAATALARFADQLRDAAPQFEKLGVQTYERDERGIAVQRDPIQIIKEVLAKTEGGDERILAKYFSNVRSMRAVAGFNVMYRAAGGGEAGMKAVEEHLNKFLSAQLSKAQIKEGAAAIRETPARQFEGAFNDLKDEIGKSLLPALTKIAPAMGKLVTAMQPLIEWLGRFVSQVAADPWKAIGDVIKVAVVGSIAKAAIGEAVAQIIKQKLVQMSLPSSGTPGAPPILAAPSGSTSGGLPVVVPPGTALPATPLLQQGARLGLGGMFSIVGIASAVGALADAAFPVDEEAERKKPLFRRKNLPSSGMGGVMDLRPDEEDALKNLFSGQKTPAQTATEVELYNKTMGSQPFGNEQVQAAGDKQKAAADVFEKAVSAFSNAATAFTGVSLGGIFGLNRGSAPSPSNASSAGGSR